MNTDPENPEKKADEELDRRQFIQRLGKTVAYAAPVVAYIASSNRAVAMSGFTNVE